MTTLRIGAVIDHLCRGRLPMHVAVEWEHDDYAVWRAELSGDMVGQLVDLCYDATTRFRVVAALSEETARMYPPRDYGATVRARRLLRMIRETDEAFRRGVSGDEATRRATRLHSVATTTHSHGISLPMGDPDRPLHIMLSYPFTFSSSMLFRVGFAAGSMESSPENVTRNRLGHVAEKLVGKYANIIRAHVGPPTSQQLLATAQRSGRHHVEL